MRSLFLNLFALGQVLNWSRAGKKTVAAISMIIVGGSLAGVLYTTGGGTPTFVGRATPGAVWAEMTADFKRGEAFNLTNALTVNEACGYMDGNGAAASGSQAFRFVLHSNLSGNPNALLGATNDGSITKGQSPGWICLAFSSSIDLTVGVYWLGIHSGQTQGVGRFSYASVPEKAIAFGPFDTFSDGSANPWGAPTGTDAGRDVAVYADFQSSPPPPPPPPPPPGGTFYLATGGNDANPCSQTLPCLSMSRAYAVSASNSIVEMAAGTYVAQTITPNNTNVVTGSPVVFQPAAGATVTFTSIRIGSSNNAALGADNITIRNGSGTLRINGANRDVYYVDRGSDNTILDGATITGGIHIRGVTVNTTIRNTSFGSYDCQQGGSICNDPRIGDDSGLSGSTPGNIIPPINVVLDNVTDHDVDATGIGPHAECLQIITVRGLTVKNSRFYRCNVSGTGSHSDILFSGRDHNRGCVSEATCGTDNDYWELNFENNFFVTGLGTNTGTSTIHMDGQTWPSSQCPAGTPVCADSFDCRDTNGDGLQALIRNNSVVGNRIWACGNNATSSTGSSLWTGNIISDGSAFLSAVQCAGSWTYNVWEAGPGCSGSNQITAAVTYVARTANPPDLHLVAGSPALARANPANFPAADIDGDTRPTPSATTPDAGADERS